MPDNLDQINVTTRRYIRTNPALVDDIYNQDALNYYLRQSLREDFGGGSTINEDFLYNAMIGGAYYKGKTFNIAQRQTEQQLRFDMKFTQVSVPLYQEDIEVLNRGDLAAIKLLRSRVDQGYMSLGAFVSIAAYLPSISPAVGLGASLNGLTEALGDGSTATWDQNTYTTYGSLTRTSYNNSLQSVPRSVTGAIEYDTIDLGYMDAFFGAGQYEPNLMMTTPKGFSYIKSKFQTQQRFQNVTLNVGVGFRGLEFNGATVLASRYCPGSYLFGSSGTADPIATTYLTETSQGAVTAYPLPSTTTSETLWILNARKPFLNYYVSTSELFGGGFRPFIPGQGNTVLVGQVLLAHNMTVHPRYHKVIYGFTA